MNHAIDKLLVPNEIETSHEVMLHLWADVEQQLAVETSESHVPTHQRASAGSRERRPSEDVTHARARYTFD